MGCGVCVLIMIEFMATEGAGAFYLLNEQCQYRRAGGPQPEGATEVFRREAQCTARCISTKRTGCAFRLVNRQGTAVLGLVRDHDSSAVTQLHGVAQRGRFRASGVLFHPLALVRD